MDVCVDLQARSLGARAWCGQISLPACRACADWEAGLWHWAVCLFVWALPRELRAGGSADGASCHMCTRHSWMLWVVASSPPSYPSTPPPFPATLCAGMQPCGWAVGATYSSLSSVDDWSVSSDSSPEVSSQCGVTSR